MLPITLCFSIAPVKQNMLNYLTKFKSEEEEITLPGTQPNFFFEWP